MDLSRLRRHDFLVLGRAGMDFYAEPPGTPIESAERFFPALGGSSANIAVAIAKLGGTASLVTTVSDDAVGRYVLNQLKTYNVATDHVRLVKSEVRTSLAVVETRAENCQSVLYRNNAADFALSESDIASLPYDKAGALIITGTALAMEPSRGATLEAIRRAAAHALPVIFDIDYRPYSWTSKAEALAVCGEVARSSQIVIGNDEEFAVLAPDQDGLAFARTLAASTAGIVVYKMGEAGAITRSGKDEFRSGIYPVRALKPTGAGDSFMGGFVTGLPEGLPLPECVRRGSAAAALVVTRVGCAPANPTRTELDTFMAETKTDW